MRTIPRARTNNLSHSKGRGKRPVRLYVTLEDRMLFDAAAMVDVAMDLPSNQQSVLDPDICQSCDAMASPLPIASQTENLRDRNDGTNSSQADSQIESTGGEVAMPLAGEQSASDNSDEAFQYDSVSLRYFLASTHSGVYGDVVLGSIDNAVDTPPPVALDFTTTASGLRFRILSEGTGNRPTALDTVTVDYRGWLPDPANPDEGQTFDSSYDRGLPSTFALQNVIAGWTEGLQLVREGGTIELEIPPSLGYGASGTASGSIPPDATLRFVVDLLSIA